MPQARQGHFVRGAPSTSTSEARDAAHPYATIRPPRKVVAQSPSDASLVQVDTAADPHPEHPTNDEDQESGAKKKSKKKNSKKNDLSGQPKTARQQNTACRACRFRRCVQRLPSIITFSPQHGDMASVHDLWLSCLHMKRWPVDRLSHAVRQCATAQEDAYLTILDSAQSARFVAQHASSLSLMAETPHSSESASAHRAGRAPTDPPPLFCWVNLNMRLDHRLVTDI
jgi:hypothetical protein